MKTKLKNIGLCLLLSAALLLQGCALNGVQGNGQVETEERDVKAFDKINVSGSYEVYIKQGGSHDLVLKMDENLLDITYTEVRGNTLYIESDFNITSAKSKKLYITVTDLEEIDISGACLLHASSELNFDDLELDLSGASKVYLTLYGGRLDIEGSGASKIELKGEMDRMAVDLSGAGKIDASEFCVKQANITISGAGKAQTCVTDDLRVDISGAGKVTYSGDPQIRKEISGAGRVSRADEG